MSQVLRVRRSSIRGLIGLYQTTIGKKVVMAISGFILYLFVILHMLGNLKVFQGAEHFNAYSEFLRQVGAPVFGFSQLLWLVRIVLLVAVLWHILVAYQLTRLDLAMRPTGYAQHRKVSAERGSGTVSSRTMRWGGVVILLFILFHLLDLTTGTLHPAFIPGDVYGNVVVGFRRWYVTAFYVLAMVALGLHLHHGVWSMFQTLGWNGPRVNGLWRGLARISAIVLAVGFSIVPLLSFFRALG